MCIRDRIFLDLVALGGDDVGRRGELFQLDVGLDRPLQEPEFAHLGGRDEGCLLYTSGTQSYVGYQNAGFRDTGFRLREEASVRDVRNFDRMSAGDQVDVYKRQG